MIIKNAMVFNELCEFEEKDIFIDDERFIGLGSGSDNDILDATGLYAIPGLIDLHFHGAIGHDFIDATIDAVEKLSTFQARNGVTSICPCTLTLPIEQILNICEVATTFVPPENGADLVGIHLEGPYFCSEKIGAQNPKYLQKPSLDDFEKIMNASNGLAKIISIAPEIDGALEFIKQASGQISCSIGHTTADYHTAIKAFDAGANHVTHLFNAMLPFGHREPGVIGAAFDTPDCMVEVISDGVHLHPAVVRVAFKMFTDDRIILISDSMMATGLSDGEYKLGGLDVNVEGNRATLADGTIAGSVTNLMQCMQNAVKNMGVKLESAVKATTVNPAKALNIFDEYGSISDGKYANLVLLDKDLNLTHVVLRGRKL